MTSASIKHSTAKRGRKCGSVSKESADKSKQIDATKTNVDPLILHLNINKNELNSIKTQSDYEQPISLSKTEDEYQYESVFYEYDPVINVPNPYDDENKFSSVPQILHNKYKESKNEVNTSTQVEIKNVIEKPVAKTITDLFQINNKEKETETSLKPNVKHHGDTSINSKTRDVVVNVLNDLVVNDEWCKQTDYLCYWDCHSFNTSPFGIPVKYKNGKYQVVGCFCSLECAVAYNFHSNENLSDMWERYNLINMMSREMKYKSVVNAAISRKCLKAFGGHLNIDEFREKSSHGVIMNVLNYPMVSLVEQVEEINDFFYKQQQDFIPLDKTRIEKIEEANKDKMLSHVKSALETTMNLRMETTQSP